MDVGALIPQAMALPASPWFFQGLLLATFAAHLLFMNAALGLCLIGLARGLAPASNPGLVDQAGLMPNLMGLTVNLGVAPLLFVQALYGRFLYVSASLLGPYWFGLVLAVMLAYFLAYLQKKQAMPGGSALIWAVMSLCLLYASMIQTQSALMVVSPGLWAGYFTSPTGVVLAWGQPTLIPRWLHFVVASVAVGGLGLALSAWKKARAGDGQAQTLVRQGMAWFSWATLAQMLGGILFLLSLPQEIMLGLMGQDPLATALFVLGICLAGLTLALGFKAKVMASAGFLVATVLVMTVIREVVRQAYLKPYFEPATLRVAGEPSTVAMFLIVLALVLGSVFWAFGQKRQA